MSRTGDDEVRGVAFLGSSGTPLVWGKAGRVVGVNPGMRLFEFKVRAAQAGRNPGIFFRSHIKNFAMIGAPLHK